MHVCVCVLVVVFLGLLLTYSFSLAHIFPYLPGFLAYVSSENRVHPTPLVQRIKFHAKMAINQDSHTHIFFGEEDNHYSTLHNFRRSKKSKWSIISSQPCGSVPVVPVWPISYPPYGWVILSMLCTVLPFPPLSEACDPFPALSAPNAWKSQEFMGIPGIPMKQPKMSKYGYVLKLDNCIS